MQKHLYIRPVLLFIFILTIVSCARTKRTKQQRLHKLQREEAILVADLEKYVQPPIWSVLKAKVIREVKEYPPAADHQYEVSLKMRDDLVQALKEFKAGNLDAQERGANVLVKIIEGGFKADTVEQGLEGLEKWIKLLENLQQQHGLQDNNA